MMNLKYLFIRGKNISDKFLMKSFDDTGKFLMKSFDDTGKFLMKSFGDTSKFLMKSFDDTRTRFIKFAIVRTIAEIINVKNLI